MSSALGSKFEERATSLKNAVILTALTTFAYFCNRTRMRTPSKHRLHRNGIEKCRHVH